MLLCTLAVMPTSFADPASASGGKSTCTGEFINPFKDICWTCIFPITIGSATVVRGAPNVGDTDNPGSPLCTCPSPVFPFFRIGVAVGFWEPARITEVVRKPYCFPTMSGMQIPAGKFAVQPGHTHTGNSNESSFYHVHWYKYPLFYMMNIITTGFCKESESFDLAYMTELDPMWADDELAFILNPEAALFANPIAHAACAADCVSATLGMPLDPLFWCAGCRGTVYPLSGRDSRAPAGISASILYTERMITKMHRMGLAWQTGGASALCTPYPNPMVQKSMYRTQMVFPRPQAVGLCCQSYGASELTYEAGRTLPVVGENYAFIIWKKRNCCVSN